VVTKPEDLKIMALPASGLNAVLDAFYEGHPEREGAELILDAFDLSAEAHEGQFRKSGEAYIHHPLAVARIVASQGLDAVSISAALLHDAVEDTKVSLEDLVDRFGPDVASIVDGVTKLERVKFDSKEHQQAATMRKMLVAMAKDIRVIIIKLADRLHNMRTIAAMPEWKQERTARETLDIYAPLAHRIGMQELKNELEDLCFAAIHPRRYAELDTLVTLTDPERQLSIDQIVLEFEECLAEHGIEHASVTGRPKNLRSLNTKMQKKNLADTEGIFDLIGIRVIVESTSEVYQALGILHGRWPPIAGRFKDFVAMPKFNFYQSIHTTVVGPNGKNVEFQLRTKEMHRKAEWGAAAHFHYKETSGREESRPEEPAWFMRLLDWQNESADAPEATDPGDFMAELKGQLDLDEVYVFTPKGKVVTLPIGATPVDFAYSIHTEVGHNCIGARVGRRLVPLDTHLESGDTVEIITSISKNPGPSQDWIESVTTSKAASKIRQWFSKERREDMRLEGRRELERALRRAGLASQRLLTAAELRDVAVELDHDDREALFVAIGEHRESTETVVRLIKERQEGEHVQPADVIEPTQTQRSGSAASSILVEGNDDIMVRIAKCCGPVPGDAITGFNTRGRGVSVHRTDCADGVSLSRAHSERVIEVEWAEGRDTTFATTLEIRAYDRARLLEDVSKTVSDHRLNIVRASTRTGDDRMSVIQIDVELGDVSQLQPVQAALRSLDSVYAAYRVMPKAERIRSEAADAD